MAPTSPLVVNVSDLLEHPGSLKRLELEERVEGLANELVRVEPTDPLRFDLTLESISEGGILVRGSVSGRYLVSCRRCLDEVALPYTITLAEVYRPRGGEQWEEGYVIDNETIDLSPAVRDNVMLDMPLYPLCREECKGLCLRCGANLNRGECACPQLESDDRWSALRSLLPGAEA